MTDARAAMGSMSTEPLYYVWSNEHRQWWGPGHRGYVTALSRAGTYTRTQAIDICRHAIGTAGHLGIFAEIPVRVEDMKEFLRGGYVPVGLL